MKKLNLLLITLVFAVSAVFAQKVRTISGSITNDVTFFNDTIYTLDGYVFVKNNATLTIQPGTIVKGKAGNKSTLIITRNGKINANGTSNQPIIFTSEKLAGQRAKGDWGGLVILGKAILNRPTDCSTCPGSAIAANEAGIQNAIEGDIDNANGDGLYGGTDSTHNAGILKFVRIEFAGTVITPGNEINGLTMGALGSVTTIENVQVSFADDDGFEWFGGSVNAKWLVSNRNVDDDLDVDFGFKGKVQFAIVLRDSNLYDIGSGPTTNGFESDNDGSGSEAKPFTDPTFSNVTVVGPLANGTALSTANSFQNGARIRRNSSTSIFNSIIMGYPDGLFVDGTRTGQKFATDSMMFRNNILAGNLRAVNNTSSNVATVRSNIFSQGTDSLFSANGVLTNAFNYTNPNFLPATGSVALSGAAFTAPRIADSYFTPTTYRGAMGTDDWTKCWCNFNPNAANYDIAPLNNFVPVVDASNDTTICIGKTVTIGKDLGLVGYSYSWSPTAGLSNATIARPVVNINTTTKYFVTVTDNATGCKKTDSITVTISPLPTVDFSSSLGSNGSVSFLNASTNAATYSWTFGDGGTSTVANPTRQYSTNGTFQVKLIVTSANGCVAQTIKQIVVTGINSPVKALSGEITTNTTLFRDTIYTLNGYVFVKNNATLTIQSGTIIKGGADKASLIITRNGKIEANGTKNQPIVFTSAKAAGQRAKGDWGGLIILGKAKVNRPTDCSTCPGSAIAANEAGIQNAIEGDIDNANGDGLYGGNDDTHNAGTLKYVRLEFGGTVITPGNEINGLTMGALGSATTLENIQVSFADDDGFEWFGGNVNGRNLISFRNVDDDLDVDFGFSGKVQNAIVLRDSNLYDIGSGPTTNGFESDNDGSGTESKPYTDPTFSNVTVVGPLANGTALSTSNSFQNGARIRRNSSTSIFNSIIMGYPDGLFVDGTRTGQKFANDSMMFRNNILAGNLRAVNNSSANASSVRASIVANGCDTLTSANGVLGNPFNYTNPNFAPAPSSIALSGASFTANRLNDPFFKQTSHRGALSANPDSNWTDCWSNFDPQLEGYTSAPYNRPGALAGFTATNGTGRTVNFTNTSSNAVAYFWNFGVTNSTTDTSVAANPSFVYPSNGSYNATLTALSPCGKATFGVTVVVNDASSNPVADFTYVQSATTGSREFTFTNTTDEKGFVTTYRWDFGVASSSADTSTVKNPVFNFPASGSYTVTLIATGTAGADTISKVLNVTPVGIKEISSTISNVTLYPNPTSNITNVSFDLTENTNVAINLYDMSGRLVKAIPTQYLTSGNNSIAIETSEVNAGVYFANITTDKFSKTYRLVIIK